MQPVWKDEVRTRFCPSCFTTTNHKLTQVCVGGMEDTVSSECLVCGRVDQLIDFALRVRRLRQMTKAVGKIGRLPDEEKPAPRPQSCDDAD